ncbi:MAG: PKD domain-containing protein, partial [Sinimarinibacterium sp.]
MSMCTGAAPEAGAARRFALRGAAAFALTAALNLTPALAADPASGTLTPTSGDLPYTAGPFVVGNPLAFATGTPVCLSDVPTTCDSYKLTVTLPDNYRSQYPAAAVVVTLGWTPAAGDIPVPGVATLPDYDLFVYEGDVGDTIGGDLLIASFGTTPIENSATANNPEIIRLAAKNGTNVYTIKSVPFAPTGEAISVSVKLDPGAPASAGGGGSGGSGETAEAPLFGAGDPAAPTAPRYQTFYAPAGSTAESDGGEYSIGFNPATKRIMTMSIGFPGPVWRLTPPEVVDPTAPESGEALWEDKSSLWESVPQVVSDPILYTDQETGRTFAANLTVGPNISYGFTDDDGENWTNVGTGISGGDHETVVSGAYPDGSPYELIAQTAGYIGAGGKGRAVYFCSQDVVGPAGCTRSDDGGLVWGPMQVVYDGTVCGGLHGHLQIASDGVAYLPVKDCGAQQGGSFTTDAGDTWTQFQVPGTAPQGDGSDPSIAIDSDKKLYFCYVNSDGHAHVKVGQRNGSTLTWSKDTDLGIGHGVTNASFPEAIGGDAGRAACGFLGTNDPSPNYQSKDFDGVWYLYIATTIDGGDTWTTVNATPNDPVQGAGGIWQQGGSGDGNGNRNLLDFNEVTLDDKGRVLFGYNDGCVTQTCLADPSKNDFVAHQRVARQTGGYTLRAAQDSAMTTLREPGRPSLSGTNTAQGLLLSWKAPDHGGSAITGYTVAKTVGGVTQQISAGNKTTYLDTAADTATASYTVTATNATGTGAASNSFNASGSTPVNDNVCAVPGKTVATDAAEDDSAPLPTAADGQGDILSVSIAEPKDMAGKLVFTLKMRSLETLPPNVNWYVIFFDPAGKKWFVSMQTDETATPSFSYGDYATSETLSNTLGDADPLSGYNATTGEISVVIAKNLVGNAAAGQNLTNVQAVTYQLIGLSMAGGSLQTIDQSSTGSYTLRAANACNINNAPTATLAADKQSGEAPLAVTFTIGMADQDAGDTLSYSLNFGDGSAAATGSANGTVQHTYTATGNKTAVLTVTDSANATDTAEVSVQVNGAGGPLAVSLGATYSKPANGDGTYTPPVTVTFTATGSGGPNSNYRYTFNFGDGTYVGPQTQATA